MFVGTYCYTRGSWSTGFDWYLNGNKNSVYNGITQPFSLLTVSVGGQQLTKDTDFELVWCVDNAGSDTAMWDDGCNSIGVYFLMLRGKGAYANSVAYLQYERFASGKTAQPLSSITVINGYIQKDGQSDVLIP